MFAIVDIFLREFQYLSGILSAVFSAMTPSKAHGCESQVEFTVAITSGAEVISAVNSTPHP